MNFIEKLTKATKKNKSLLCVGLDPDPERMPEKISVAEFNKGIIDATSDLVCAYKPNLAFYEALGSEGLAALEQTIEHIPDYIPIIGDAKRGDIGNTAKAYAKSIFAHYNFDAATVNPYSGFDSIEPFIRYKDKGIFILCRTSNTGAIDFQSLRFETASGYLYLFEIVAMKAREWNIYGNVGLIIGATYPNELRLLRQTYPDMPLLIPGIGAQGGELSSTIQYGVDAHGEKAIINSSRQIIYASRGKDFAEAARWTASSLRDEMNHHLAKLNLKPAA